MLPTSRVISALLVGGGVACLTAGVAAPRFLDAQPTLPLDLEHSTWTITDEAAQTRLVQDGRQLRVPVTAQMHVALQDPADADTVTARVGTTWMRESQQAEADRLISAQVWSYPLDRLTGTPAGGQAEATLTHTIGFPTADVPISGQWFKFPAHAEKTTYDVWDETLRGTAPAVFEEETTLEGRTVYRYHQRIEPTNIALRYAGMFNTINREEGTAYLYHSATRDFYVDQATGMVVDMDVDIKDFYGDLDGKELENSLTFAGSISEEDTAQFLEQAAGFHHTTALQITRWALIIGGSILTLVALAGVFGAFSRRGGRHRGSADAPAS